MGAFSRNALKPGLQVVQAAERSPMSRERRRLQLRAAVAAGDQRDGRRMSLRTVPLIASSRDSPDRGIYNLRDGRREFKTAVETSPRSRVARRQAARRMTSTSNQIRVASNPRRHVRGGHPGATLSRLRRPAAGLDGTRAILDSHLQPITGPATRIFPRSGIANNHSSSPARRRQQQRRSARVRAAQRLEEPLLTRPPVDDGIFHFYFPEQALVRPGQFNSSAGRLAQAAHCAYVGGRRHCVGSRLPRFRLVDVAYHLLHRREARR